MILENFSVSKCSTWNFRLKKIKLKHFIERIFYLILLFNHNLCTFIQVCKKIVSLFSKLTFSQRTDKYIEFFENMVLIDTLMFVKN